MAASSAKRVSDLAAFCNTMCMSVIPQVLMLFFMEFTHYWRCTRFKRSRLPIKVRSNILYVIFTFYLQAKTIAIALKLK